MNNDLQSLEEKPFSLKKNSQYNSLQNYRMSVPNKNDKQHPILGKKFTRSRASKSHHFQHYNGMQSSNMVILNYDRNMTQQQLKSLQTVLPPAQLTITENVKGLKTQNGQKFQSISSDPDYVAHIVDDFLSDLTYQTGGSDDTSSLENVSEKITNSRSCISYEQNILNQAEIIIASGLIEAEEKVKMLGQKIRDLVADITLQKQVIQKFIEMNDLPLGKHYLKSSREQANKEQPKVENPKTITPIEMEPTPMLTCGSEMMSIAEELTKRVRKAESQMSMSGPFTIAITPREPDQNEIVEKEEKDLRNELDQKQVSIHQFNDLSRINCGDDTSPLLSQSQSNLINLYMKKNFHLEEQMFKEQILNLSSPDVTQDVNINLNQVVQRQEEEPVIKTNSIEEENEQENDVVTFEQSNPDQIEQNNEGQDQSVSNTEISAEHPNVIFNKMLALNDQKKMRNFALTYLNGNSIGSFKNLNAFGCKTPKRVPYDEYRVYENFDDASLSQSQMCKSKQSQLSIIREVRYDYSQRRKTEKMLHNDNQLAQVNENMQLESEQIVFSDGYTTQQQTEQRKKMTDVQNTEQRQKMTDVQNLNQELQIDQRNNNILHLVKKQSRTIDSTVIQNDDIPLLVKRMTGIDLQSETGENNIEIRLIISNKIREAQRQQRQHRRKKNQSRTFNHKPLYRTMQNTSFEISEKNEENEQPPANQTFALNNQIIPEQ